MAQRGQAHARRRSAMAIRSYDYTLMPHIVASEFDDCRYDDVLRPALRVRATLRLDENGEPAELTDIIADRRLS